MPVLNPSFEDAGLLPGEAEHWTLVSVASLEAIAGFGADPELAWEGFERWVELLDDFDGVTVALALFDPLAEGYEDFEDAWDNDLYLIELPTGQMSTAPFGGGAVEDFDDGWDNVPYATAWEDVAGVIGLFDAEPREDFNEQWHGNEAFAWTWAAVVSAAALFDGGAQPVENYKDGWDPAVTL